MFKGIAWILSAFALMLVASLSFLVWSFEEGAQVHLTSGLFVALFLIIGFWLAPRGFAPSRAFDPFHPAVLFGVFVSVYVGLSAALIWLMHDYGSAWFDLGSNPITKFNQALCLASFACVFYGLGLRVPSWPQTEDRLQGSLISEAFEESRNLTVVTYLFFFLGFCSTAYHLSLYGDANLLALLSPSARRDAGVSVSQLLVIIESMLAWSAIFAVILIIRTRVKFHLVLLILVAITMVYLSSAKRTAVLPIILIPLIYYHYCHSWLSLFRSLRYFVGLATLLVVGVLARMAIPVLIMGDRPSDYMGESTAAVMEYYAISGEFMTFDMFLMTLINSSEILKNMSGGLFGFLEYSFGTLLVLIPRSIWPGKPDFLDVGNIYHDIIAGGTDVGFAITIFGSSYLFFGLIGLTFGMFFFSWIHKSVYDLLRPDQGRLPHVITYAVFYWMVFQALRFGTLGFTFIVFIQTMVVGVFAVWMIVFLRRYHFLCHRVDN